MKFNFKSIQKLKRVFYFLQKEIDNPLSDSQAVKKIIVFKKTKENIIYEANIDPILRFMHRTEIKSTSWIVADECLCNDVADVDIDLLCKDWRTLKPYDDESVAPFIVASFDIECNSSTGKFPDPFIPGDCCFQIGITLKKMGEERPFVETCLCYKDTINYNAVCYDNERDMLMGFQKFLKKHDVDILTGYNIWGFDLRFIMHRAVIVGCPEEFYNLGKLKEVNCELTEKKLSSSALGDNTLYMVPMSGRYTFDLFQEIL